MNILSFRYLNEILFLFIVDLIVEAWVCPNYLIIKNLSGSNKFCHVKFLTSSTNNLTQGIY